MTSEKKTELTHTYAPFAGAAGLKTVERAVISRKNKQRDFKSFDEVLDHYKSAKPGDVLFFQETFMGGKGHPIVVLDGDTQFYWPAGDGYQKGIKKPLAVPKTPEHLNMVAQAKKNPEEVGRAHIKKILQESGLNHDVNDYWAEPYKGKFFEVRVAKPGSGVNPIEVGSLEGKLWNATAVRNKIKNSKSPVGYSWKEEFSPKGARRLGELYRPKHINLDLLNQKADEILSKGERGDIHYKILSRKFDLNAPCTKGHCLLGADELLRQAGVPRGKPALTPGAMAKGLDLVTPARTIATGRVNMSAPILVGAGGIAAYQGQKKENKKKFMAGLGVAGAGVAVNAIKPVKSSFDALGGLVARSVGGYIMETPAKLIDKYNSRNKYIPEQETRVYAVKEWLNKNPKAAARLGATVLGVPAAYGLYKGLSSVGEVKPEPQPLKYYKG